MQLRDEALRALPTLYFGPGTAAERVLTSTHPERPRRIGIVGMGAGTLASYGRPGDVMRFYEIDGNVVDLAQVHFSFLKDSKAHIEIVLGDGRLSLQQEAPQQFDVLVLDAFSSDAVPVHLLTREAFQIYRTQLADDGVLLVNVSNRHLAVDRVVRANARALGWECVLSETPTNTATHVTHVVWALLGQQPSTLRALTASMPSLTPTTTPVGWTDARASILSILR
jgi:spermidine synthase